MWIEVKIPYEPGRKLANAYNRAMKTARSRWVLLLDQDVFLCNPRWYQMCLNAIAQVDKGIKAGLIVCMTGGSKQKVLQRVSSVDSSDIDYHISLARSLYQQYGNELKEIDTTITGFFMLVRRQAWKKVQFHAMGSGVGGVDIDFSKRLLEAGFTIWLMTGLYVYHRRGLRKLKFNVEKPGE